ncbi:MAG TPA: carboxypeptidase-like regulatory domain-containing protein [Blastocatellia bacterium]|nr:carboxypeptidase-like regulatory domain-containing protein [Blastocatellia bacterium]HMZ20977.1 carboxypeptidase-like regulatory domain-containing protein [Blastocatellia bacterium]HNG31335.1 carboxypeptidase-like regulatory domain-containing protein [Blastocatellia bacterium]
MKPGSITGRVLGDDGQPLAAIPVFAAPIGRAGAAGRRQGGGASSQTTTDDEGNFEFANLPPASYSIAATVPGYIAPPAEEETGAGIYRPGDAVTITLIKGGVITGKVVNATGEPLTGISVNAIRVGGLNGEEEDQTTSQGGFRGFQRNWRTDDRGVYRIYGLIPGSYIVQAGGNGGPNPLSPFSQDAPTYYPSSAREAAVPLAVRAGDEAAGIDIRYRGEKGRAISGKVLAKAGEASSDPAPVQISLLLAGTDSVIASTVQAGRGANNGFALYGIPDGEYDITARRGNFGALESDAVAAPRRVTVRGADVGGIQLTLAPLALLGGKVILEKKPGAPACPAPRKFFVEEILLRAERDEPSTTQDAALTRVAPRRLSAPSAQGDFTLRNLEAGRWRLVAKLPDENWYIRAMMPDGKASAVTAVRKAATPPPINLARNGVTFKLGEKLTNAAVIITEGAAGLSGKVAGNVRVFAVPAEKEAADDVLRYAQTTTTADGSFHLKHLAPGRYYLLAKPIKGNEGSDVHPLAWDSVQRAALRREAETATQIVELQPCQRLNDYKLGLGANQQERQ